MIEAFAAISDALREGIANAFWSVATSLPVLGALAAIVVAGFVARFLPVQIIPGPAQGYVTLARFSGTIALAAIMFLIGFRVADERIALRDLRAEIRFKDRQLENIRISEQDKASLAAAMAARADALQSKEISPYVAKVEALPASAACLATADDARFVLERRENQKRRRSTLDRLRGSGD